MVLDMDAVDATEKEAAHMADLVKLRPSLRVVRAVVVPIFDGVDGSPLGEGPWPRRLHETLNILQAVWSHCLTLTLTLTLPGTVTLLRADMTDLLGCSHNEWGIISRESLGASEKAIGPPLAFTQTSRSQRRQTVLRSDSEPLTSDELFLRALVRGARASRWLSASVRALPGGRPR